MSSSRGLPSCLLTTAPAMTSSRCFGFATVTSWNFSSSLRKGVEIFRHFLQSATPSAVSLALPVTATPEESSIALRISLRENGSFGGPARSEEHTSELQSRFDLVCRLLLEKKKYNMKKINSPYCHEEDIE